MGSLWFDRNSCGLPPPFAGMENEIDNKWKINRMENEMDSDMSWKMKWKMKWK